MTTYAEEVYKNYWKGGVGEQQKHAYYDRLYKHLRHRIEVPETWKKLDVAGGNGEFLRYFGIHSADVLDISDSGLEQARSYGYVGIKGDVQRR